MLNLIGVEKKHSKKYKHRNNEVKKLRLSLGFEPVLSASELCCPTSSFMETIGTADKC